MDVPLHVSAERRVRFDVDSILEYVGLTQSLDLQERRPGDRFSVDGCAEVLSSSQGGWFKGRITKIADGRVTVEFYVARRVHWKGLPGVTMVDRYTKTVHVSSTDVALEGTHPTAVDGRTQEAAKAAEKFRQADASLENPYRSGDAVLVKSRSRGDRWFLGHVESVSGDLVHVKYKTFESHSEAVGRNRTSESQSETVGRKTLNCSSADILHMAASPSPKNPYRSGDAVLVRSQSQGDTWFCGEVELVSGDWVWIEYEVSETAQGTELVKFWDGCIRRGEE